MSLTGNAALAGVMGWPISHSRSPRLHGYWLEQYGIDGAYVPLAVAPLPVVEELQRPVRGAPVVVLAGDRLVVLGRMGWIQFN